MVEEIKRMKYFTGEFLKDIDFQDEQQYHMNMQRYHNKNLHTWGIASGLDVPDNTGGTTVTIKSGMAIDALGRQIIQLSDVPGKTFPVGLTILPDQTTRDLFLTISYTEKETYPRPDNPDQPPDQQTTRFTEEPEVKFFIDNPPANASIDLVLAKVIVEKDAIDNTIKIKKIDRSVRTLAGAVVGDLKANSIALSIADVAVTDWPRLKGVSEVGGANPGIEITSDKTKVIGDLEVTGTLSGNLAANTVDSLQIKTDAVTADKIALNSVGTTELADSAVNALKLAAGAVTTAKLSTAVQNDINTGKNHAQDVNNPHTTTAEQVDNAGGVPNQIVTQINAGDAIIKEKNIDPLIREEKLNGKFHCGRLTVVVNDPVNNVVRTDTVTITSQDVRNKIISIRGWASTNKSKVPGLLFGDEGWWTPLPTNFKEGWVITPNGSSGKDFFVFNEIDSNGNPISIRCYVQIGENGISFYFQGVGVGTVIGYAFQFTWQYEPYIEPP